VHPGGICAGREGAMAMTETEERVAQILESGFDTPQIFKSILKKETGLGKDDEILDVIHVRREYMNERDPSSRIHEPAKLLVATQHGLVLAEEGFFEIAESIMGYKIKLVGYDKIATIELDVSMLDGEFLISAYGETSAQMKISFNTAKYYREFRAFIDLLRRKAMLA
jgi:hypothetical protein